MPLGSSGAGAYGAGVGPAGWDPAAAPGARTTTAPVASTKYDPFNRTYLTNDDNTLQSEDPVIHRVRHILGMRRRGVQSTPTVGIRLGRLRTCRASERQRVAEDAVREALEPLLSAGDIAILGVELSNPWDGTIYPLIQNLRLPQSKPQRLTATLAED